MPIRTIPTVAFLLAGLLCVDAPAATIGYWRFEGGGADWLLDTSGNEHHLTVSGSVAQAVFPLNGAGSTFQNPVPLTGAENTAMASFAGGYTYVADHADFTVSDFSIEAYVNKQVQTSGTQYIASQLQTTGNDRSWALGVAGTDTVAGTGTANKLFAILSEAGTAATVFASSLTIDVGSDYFVAVSYDQAGGVLRFYAQNLTEGGDLQIAAVSHSIPTLYDSNAPLRIGRNHSSSGVWQGVIDEVRFTGGVLNSGQLLAPDSAIQFDFGGTAGGTYASGAIGPAHASNGGEAIIPESRTTWNQVTTSDVASGLLFANGTPATGISIDLGVEASSGAGSTSSQVINFGFQDGLVSTASSSPPPHLSNYLGRNYLRAGTNDQGIGAKVTGLEPGTYFVYVIADNPSSATMIQGNVFVGVSDGSDTLFDYSELGSEYLENNPASHSGTSTWLFEDNYARFAVTVGEGEAIYIVMDDAIRADTMAAQPGRFTGIQITLVPEPGSWLLLAVGGIVLAMLRRRRRVR